MLRDVACKIQELTDLRLLILSRMSSIFANSERTLCRFYDALNTILLESRWIGGRLVRTSHTTRETAMSTSATAHMVSHTIETWPNFLFSPASKCTLTISTEITIPATAVQSEHCTGKVPRQGFGVRLTQLCDTTNRDDGDQ